MFFCASVEAQNAALSDAEAHIERRCPDMILGLSGHGLIGPEALSRLDRPT